MIKPVQFDSLLSITHPHAITVLLYMVQLIIINFVNFAFVFIIIYRMHARSHDGTYYSIIATTKAFLVISLCKSRALYSQECSYTVAAVYNMSVQVLPTIGNVQGIFCKAMHVLLVYSCIETLFILTIPEFKGASIYSYNLQLHMVASYAT